MNREELDDVIYKRIGMPSAMPAVRAALDEYTREVRATVLREAADEMEAEYERRTALSGAYGQMKIRAALRMGAGMNRLRADRIEKEADR